jgi:hypothetical protein
MTAARSQPPRLKVFGQGRDHYIPVPHQWAADLRAYLITKGIFARPPQPFDGDTFSIALPPKTDAELVQAFLDRWGKAA